MSHTVILIQIFNYLPHSYSVQREKDYKFSLTLNERMSVRLSIRTLVAAFLD